MSGNRIRDKHFGSRVILNPRYRVVDVQENGKGDRVYTIEKNHGRRGD